jgi:hypothetical protein
VRDLAAVLGVRPLSSGSYTEWSAGVADASKQVRFGVDGVGVCEVVMCT